MSFQIRLKNFQVTELELKVNTFEKDVTVDTKTTFSYSFGSSKENKNDFAIFFILELDNDKNNFSLKINAVSHFEANSPLDENFESSSFAKISAPAIAFPYLRAFLSNLTLNAGFESIILPSFNFVTLSEEIQKEKED